MPRIGWVVDMPPEPKKALDELAGKVHVWLSYLLYVLLAAHLIGAAKHQWFDRVPTLAANDVPRRRTEVMANRAPWILLLLGALAPAALPAANLGAVVSYEKTAHGIAGRTATVRILGRCLFSADHPRARHAARILRNTSAMP